MENSFCIKERKKEWSKHDFHDFEIFLYTLRIPLKILTDLVTNTIVHYIRLLEKTMLSESPPLIPLHKEYK